MADTVCSLYKLCICSISELVLKIVNKGCAAPLENPFSVLYPNALHDIIGSACEKANEENECFKSCYVYLLITTGRLTSFELTVAYIVEHEAEEIFKDLQPYSNKLKSLKLNYKDPLDCLYGNSLWTSSNLGILLSSAKNLVCLETGIDFSFSELSHCKNLEKLTLNYMIGDHLSSFLYVGNEICYNHSLRMLRILNIKANKGHYREIAEILQYCTEIIEIDYDVSESLVYLHKTKKATKYKLQKTLLGNILYPRRVSAETIRIASLYCPDLRTVEVSPKDYPAFKALIDFRNITNLTLHEPRGKFEDFNQAIRPLLESSHFGPKLKTLVLRYFSDLDVSCIGKCCPRLEEFTVEFVSENNQSEFTTDSFRNLTSLFFKHVMAEPCRADSIIALLSKSEKLEFLTIDDASELNDTVLDIMLKNTKLFSKVKYLTIGNCGLTRLGLEKFAQSMISLERVSCTSNLISVNDIDRIFRRFRPNIARYSEVDE